MEVPITRKVSKELGIPEEELIEKGLIAFLEKELHLAEQDIANLRNRYGVSSPQQLEELISARKIYSHPAWEDLIMWENILQHMEKVKKLLGRIQLKVA